MSLSHNGAGTEPSDPSPDQTVTLPPPAHVRRTWQSRLLTVCFAIFALEVGLFLVVFPWQDTWSINYFLGLFPSLEGMWEDPYFRGALTGLGFVNIYIAGVQAVRLFRRW